MPGNQRIAFGWINMYNADKNRIEFIVTSVNEFAAAKELAVRDAFLYLHKYKGIEYLKEFYDIEHTLPEDMTLEALTLLCQRNGWLIK
jgi:hypothetical protein